ncbi:uncharacterized protein LTR77_002789 [Saxophila tyrrhenica]|uniref:BRCT domain-containing protein n=1 Tax=Saxophila tyrrhenica TaxID=1690608 RepID=A0AAV9PID7_9PEZI|nr:hypothetical protein LTR77_002789 [Saxophila tyrrhenica]
MSELSQVVAVVETRAGAFSNVTLYHSHEDAKDAGECGRMRSDGLSHFELRTLTVMPEGASNAGATALTTKTRTKKKKAKADHPASPDSLDDDELTQLGTDPKEKTPKPKRPLTEKELENRAARQKVPTGSPTALLGWKVIFVGTLGLEHKALETATTQCGGEVVKKIEEANYIVVGKKPGTKSQELMQKSTADQISEAAFISSLRPDAEDEMLDGFAQVDSDAEPPMKKQKKN